MCQESLNTDIDALAVQLKASILADDRNLINELLIQMEPEIRRIAESVCRGAYDLDRVQFVEEASLRLIETRTRSLPRICLYDPNGCFESWAGQVLRRLWLSRKRSEGTRNRRRVHDENAVKWIQDRTEQNYGERTLVEMLGYPFTLCDCKQILSWTIREQVELLSVSGFYVRMPRKSWERALTSYEEKYTISLPRPFPDFPPSDCDDKVARLNLLADWLGTSKNTLEQRIIRGREKLTKIPSMRSLLRDMQLC